MCFIHIIFQTEANFYIRTSWSTKESSIDELRYVIKMNPIQSGMWVYIIHTIDLSKEYSKYLYSLEWMKKTSLLHYSIKWYYIIGTDIPT